MNSETGRFIGLGDDEGDVEEVRKRMAAAFDIATPDPASSADDTENGVAKKAAALESIIFRIDASKGSPNLKYTGRREYDAAKRKVLKENSPIESFQDGPRKIVLPPADFQIKRRLFYHSDAKRIARAFPHLYKLVVPKVRPRS